MFKFIKQYTETIKDVDIYAYMSMFIFMIFFIVLLVLVKKMSKERVNTLSNLPFDKAEINNSSTN